jgi:Protein of unknown function (DUF2505)
MARRIEHRTRSPWDVKTVYTTLVDPTYLNARLAELGGTGAQLAEHRVAPDGQVSYRLRHGVEARHLPPAVRTMLGGDLKIDRTETWRPDPAGGYTGTVSVTIPGMPGNLGGRYRLSDDGNGGTTQVMDGSVQIPIPLVGGRIEETVADQISKLLDAEHTFTEGWLDQHRS